MKKDENKKRNGDFRALNLNDGGHLSDEEIIAYRYGNLSPVELERRAQNHLVECRRCAGALLELSAFTESANSPTNRENTDIQWAQFEQKRRAAAGNIEQPSILKPKTGLPFWNSYFKFPSFNLAGAAAFGVLATIIGGGIFWAFFRAAENPGAHDSAVVLNPPPAQKSVGDESDAPEKSVAGVPEKTLENNAAGDDSNRRISKRGKQNSSPPAPRTKNKTTVENADASPPKIFKTPAFQEELALNRIDVSLYPNEVVRGGAAAEEARKIRVERNSVEQIRLKLNAPKSAARSAFSVEIRGAQNIIVLTLPVLPDKRGDFSLTIPANKLPAALYSLKIYAEKDKSRVLYAEYGFEIAYE